MELEKTTIQVSESLRKRIKILASPKDISYEDLLNSLLDIFELSISFKSENDFAKFFEENVERFEFKKIVERKHTSNIRLHSEDLNGEKDVENIRKN